MEYYYFNIRKIGDRKFQFLIFRQIFCIFYENSVNSYSNEIMPENYEKLIICNNIYIGFGLENPIKKHRGVCY